MIINNDSAPGNPSVLIGITTLNRANTLPKALNSAKEQNYKNKKIIVIDDASTDGTSKIRETFPDVEWFHNKTSRGLRENRNRMMQISGYKYFVSLDDDAWFLQGDEVTIAVTHMEHNPKLAAIAFDILSPDSSHKRCRSKPRKTHNYIGCGHILRLSAVKEAGWYENSPGAYGAEERDLCLRLMNKGYSIDILPGVHVWHDKAWDNRDWFPLHKSGVCNDLFLTIRRCPFPDIFITLPLKIISHLKFGIKNPEMLHATFSGITFFMKKLPESFKTRKAVRRDVFWFRDKK